MKRKQVRIAALLILLVAGLFLTTSITQAAHVRTYKVTITNLSDGQPLTPPLLTTHSLGFEMFDVGDPASFELKEIAENGNLGPMIDTIMNSTAVYQHVVGDAPLVPASDPGGSGFSDSATYMIEAVAGQNGLSWTSMLICTNDGFTGIDSIRLPKHVGETVTAYTQAYDAGTEVNTEDFADIVPPCQGLIGVSSADEGTGTSNPDLAEGGVIHHHGGVVGGNDLEAIHDWSGPIAQITIERVDN